MRLGCLPPLIAIGLVIGGGQGLYTALTNRAPKVFTIEQYLRTKPKDKWLRLTGGVVRVMEATSKRILASGPVTEVFVPVRLKNQTSDDPIAVLLATRDADTRHLVDGMQKLVTEKDQLAFALAHANELSVHRDVEGLVRFGIDSKDRDQRKRRGLYQNLAPEFVVLEEGKKPDLTESLMLFAGGLVLGGWLLKRALRPSTPSTIENWPPPPSRGPPPLPPPLRPGDPPLRQG